MGLFSSKKKIQVASVTYNLAGEDEPVNYLAGTVLNSILFTPTADLAGDIQDSYINGPGLRIRKFPAWCERNGYYNEVGHATSSFGSNNLDYALLTQIIPYDRTQYTITITIAEIGPADFSNWADVYIIENYPELADEDAEVDLDEDTMLLTITFVDEDGEPTGEVITTTLTDYNPNLDYLYVQYTLTEIVEEPEEPEETTYYIIYGRGTGNPDYDRVFPTASSGSDTFYPIIPFRIDNRRVTEGAYPTLYPLAVKAYKKVMAAKYETLMASILNNNSIGDIDYAYVIFGVGLNAKDDAARYYIFAFFKYIINITGEFEETELEGGTPGRFLQKHISITSGRHAINYNIQIRWNSARYEYRSGLGKPDAKQGKCWFTSSGNTIYMWYQTTLTNHEVVIVGGLNHSNWIYGGKSVETDGITGLYQTDASDFVIPLHDTIYREIGLVKGTQMANYLAYIMFNCYEVKKVKWYQTGIFKVVLLVVSIVITIAISVITAGVGGIAGGGIGASLTASLAATGLSVGTAALVSAILIATAKAFAAIVLTKLLIAGATQLFGDQLGAIIGAIASTIALSIASGILSGQTFGQALMGLGRADTLIKITSSAADAYNKALQTSATKLMNQTQDVLRQYEEEFSAIDEKWKEVLGNSTNIDINPLNFTDSLISVYESSDTFLSRTLLTGQDIAEITLGMIDKLQDLNLNLNLETTSYS